LKNAIDWVTRVREDGEPAYAAFKDRVFALGCAVPAAAGGAHGLMALRQILELGCGALVLPEQINVGRAEAAFDDMDNLKDEDLTADLKHMVRRLIELASAMPRTRE
jgi:chromate reductase, NAD(P)H dehydrogenase (quinone)